jgi:uncharacterized protein
MGLIEYVGIQLFLQDILGRPVDLVTRDGLHPRLKDRILGEAICAA